MFITNYQQHIFTLRIMLVTLHNKLCKNHIEAHEDTLNKFHYNIYIYVTVNLYNQVICMLPENFR